jgi:hypothetical protein
VFARRAEILNTPAPRPMTPISPPPGLAGPREIIEAFIGPLIELSLTGDEG